MQKFIKALILGITFSFFFFSCSNPIADAVVPNTTPKESEPTELSKASLQTMNIIYHGTEIENRVIERYPDIAAFYEDDNQILRSLAITSLFPVANPPYGISLTENFIEFIIPAHLFKLPDQVQCSRIIPFFDVFSQLKKLFHNIPPPLFLRQSTSKA